MSGDEFPAPLSASTPQKDSKAQVVGMSPKLPPKQPPSPPATPPSPPSPAAARPPALVGKEQITKTHEKYQRTDEDSPPSDVILVT